MARTVSILMDSEGVEGYAEEIGRYLKDLFGLRPYFTLVSSCLAPDYVLETVKHYDSLGNPEGTVHACVAGGSDMLSGLVDGATLNPVFAARPFADRETAYTDTTASLRMPANVSPMTVLGPENTAVHIAKAFGHGDDDLRKEIAKHLEIKDRTSDDGSSESIALMDTPLKEWDRIRARFGRVVSSKDRYQFHISNTDELSVPHVRVSKMKKEPPEPTANSSLLYMDVRDKRVFRRKVSEYAQKMGRGQDPLVVGLENSILAAMKIVGMHRPHLRERLKEYMESIRAKISDADRDVWNKLMA
jgi:phosphoribosylcarboxyaminoimidazole (NCAIR) mutase